MARHDSSSESICDRQEHLIWLLTNEHVTKTEGAG